VILLGTLRFLRYVFENSASWSGRVLSAQLLQVFG